MNLALAKTETGRALSDIFAVARDRLPGAGKVAELRQQAFEAYERAGLPHRRIEDWKYTDLWQLPERLYDDPEELTGWARAALAAAERAALAKRPKGIKKVAKKNSEKKKGAKKTKTSS